MKMAFSRTLWICSLVISTLLSSGISTAQAVAGDVNNDGVVNVFDALRVLQNAVGLYHPSDEPAFKSNADVAPLDANCNPKGDSKVDVFDALAILRHSVNLDAWIGSCPPPPPPSSPTNLKATAGNASITFSWDTVFGATGYNLYYRTSSGVTNSNGIKISGATSPKTISGLNGNVSYYAVVTAVNSNGESALSQEVNATPIIVPPPITYPNNGNCGNSVLQGKWYESTGGAYTHFPAQVVFVNSDSMNGYFYGYAAGALGYTFETEPTMCGSMMIIDGAQRLILSYNYTVSKCELILVNWGRTHHYCKGGIGNCFSCN